MKDNMKEFLIDLALLLKKHGMIMFTDNCGGLTIEEKKDSNVSIYIDNGEVDVPEIAAILDKDENPHKEAIIAENINDICLYIQPKEFIDVPDRTFSWQPIGVSMDSGYLTFDMGRVRKNRNGDFEDVIQMCIRKHGFIETIEHCVNVNLNDIHSS